MKKNLMLIFMLFALMMPLMAQQGEYARKSVSSLGYVWLAPEVSIAAFDTRFFSTLLSEYIEVNRFDYNELSLSSLAEFKRRAGSLRTANVNAFGEIMRETVGRELLWILSDPEIQKARRENLEDESSRIRLARIKGREFGLTAEQLQILMNSAYLYLPYVSEAGWVRNGDEVHYEIKGGIIWYQFKLDPHGKMTIEMVEATPTSGQGSCALDGKTKTYKFRGHSFTADSREYAMYGGMHAWAKNLSINMRQIPDFSLSGQLLERHSKTKFSTSLGRKDGVFLDDSFRVLELYEDHEGNIKRKRIGFGRIVKNIDSRDDRNAGKLSMIKLHSADKVMPGAVLEEYPLLGLELDVYGSYAMDISVPRELFYNPSAQDVDHGMGINAQFAYNIAPIIGHTQTFVESEFSAIFIDPKIELGENHSTIYSIYLGLSKKMWIRRAGLYLGAKAGADIFASETDRGFSKDEIFATDFAAKADAKLIYMLSPSLQIAAGVSHGIPSGMTFGSVTRGGNKQDLPDHLLDKMELSGTRINLGFNWLLKQWAFNIFAWLDPLKSY